MTGISDACRDRLPAAPLVVVTILNWNGWQKTIECLESVYGQDYPNFLTVVFDNGSWDGSQDRIRRWAIARLGREAAIVDYDALMALSGGRFKEEAALRTNESSKRLVLIRSRENLGWAGANNVVVAYALRVQSARFVFFLNNDAILDPRSLSQLADVGLRFPKAVLAPAQASPCLNSAFLHPSLSLSRFLFAPLVSPERPVRNMGPLSESGVVSGAAMLVSTALLEDFLRLDGECFSSKIFLYWEDQLFCHLARCRGSVIGNVPQARVWHEGSASSGGALGPLLFYYRERGKIFAANAVLPFGMRLLFHAVNPLLCLARAVKYALRSPACAQAALCGLADGLRGIGGKWRDHNRFASPPMQPPLLRAEEKRP